MTSHIIIVGADKGGVGKTTTSRALLAYLKGKNIDTRAFDTEYPIGVLKRFYPDTTDIVDLTSSDGQMTVFDNVAKASTTVIDIRAGLLSPSLQVLGEIGLLEGVKDGRYRMTLLHIIGASIASFREIEATKLASAGARHMLVMNHLNSSSFFEWKKDVRDVMAGNDGVIEIPRLDELAMEHIDQLGVPFPDYVADEAQSMVLRGKTRHWMQAVYSQFDRTLGL